ncbi:hypothetical protein Bca4012_069427 [Brassica carinata]
MRSLCYSYQSLENIQFSPLVFNVLKKFACLLSCDDDVHVCLFPCNHVMRKKLVSLPARMEMVRTQEELES